MPNETRFGLGRSDQSLLAEFPVHEKKSLCRDIDGIMRGSRGSNEIAWAKREKIDEDETPSFHHDLLYGNDNGLGGWPHN